jgi:ketose-bisphosphate aldolase
MANPSKTKQPVMPTTRELMLRAWKMHIVIPAFNVPFLPMLEPIVRALRDTDNFGLIQVARLEWIKFQAQSLKAVRDEYERFKDPRHTRLHLDHVPVVDEDGRRVEFLPIFREAAQLGYQSFMIDGSRLPLEENIAATRQAVELGRQAGIPVEAELGAVLGHETGPLPPYEQLFQSGKGFTDPAEAGRFVRETDVDWLSVAIGNIHGAIAAAAKSQKKVAARLNLDQLDRIQRQAATPLVLHGGSGIQPTCIRDGIRRGIAKINICTTIRQPYETLAARSIAQAQTAVYQAVRQTLTDELGLQGSTRMLEEAG